MDDQEFQQLIADCKIPDEGIADILGVSRPTVTRWRKGKNLPHPIMRNSIVQAIEDALTKEWIKKWLKTKS